MFYLNSILYLIGLITVIIWLCKAFNFINTYFLQSSKFHRCKQNRPNGENPWALVTEVTSTIGLTFAHEIASRGFNVVLQGSNKDDLKLVKSDYEKLHPTCSFITLVVDSCIAEGVDFEAILNQLEPLNLTVLVNNAGRRLEEIPFGLLTSFSHARIAQDISANITFPLLLMKTVLPLLGRNTPSLIITVGTTQDRGLPLLATHAASMSFLRSMTDSLALEMKLGNYDLELINVNLGTTAGVGGPNLLSRPVDEAVKAALARAWCGRRSLHVQWAQGLAESMNDFVPRRVWEEGIVSSMRIVAQDAVRRRDITTT
jgi:short-subunit dehydrogenase